MARGRKTSHWMWFVLPQLAGLGMSSTAQFYAIADLDEAKDYLAHPVLGPRLREASSLIAASETSTAEQLMGSVDAVKLRSSMTLFQLADPTEPVFRAVLDRVYDGIPDQRTLDLLRQQG